MKRALSVLLMVLWFVGAAWGEEKKEMTAEEKAKKRSELALLDSEIAACMALADDKDMPANLTEGTKWKVQQKRKLVLPAIPENLTAPSKKHKILMITFAVTGAHVDAQGAMLVLLHRVARKTEAWAITDVLRESDLLKIGAEQLKEYDAVVVNNNFPCKDDLDMDAEGKAKLQTFYDEVLPGYVKSGGGLFVYHWGIRGVSKPYSQMVGGNFGGHPPGDGEIFQLKVLDPKNPLMASFVGEPAPQDQFQGGWATKAIVHMPHEYSDELYVYNMKPSKDPAVRVLLELDMEKLSPQIQFPKGTTAIPEIWVKHFGEGRIFYSQFGHSADNFTRPLINRSMLDGLQYVLGDLKVDDSPVKPEN